MHNNSNFILLSKKLKLVKRIKNNNLKKIWNKEFILLNKIKSDNLFLIIVVRLNNVIYVYAIFNTL